MIIDDWTQRQARRLAMLNVALLRADPHDWGMGHVHEIDDERDQTLCGKNPARCPGKRFQGTRALVTCRGCQRSIEAMRRQIEHQRTWRVEREQSQHEWRRLYDQYLISPEWHRKRALVMKRAGELCEGCGQRRATQVHHLRYPRNCWPGSAEWLAQEKLFDLRAICGTCHDDVHHPRPVA
jgi:hypothetical protein